MSRVRSPKQAKPPPGEKPLDPRLLPLINLIAEAVVRDLMREASVVAAPPQAETILRLPAVKARVGLSRSTLYQRIADGLFPAPIRLGPRAVGWLEADIEAWIAAQIASSRGA